MTAPRKTLNEFGRPWAREVKLTKLEALPPSRPRRDAIFMAGLPYPPEKDQQKSTREPFHSSIFQFL